MTDFTFCWFSDYDDGKIARLETMDYEIPVNIYADPGTDFTLTEGDPCSVDIYGLGGDVQFFRDEEAYEASGAQMAPVSMIPAGTFPANPGDEDFQQKPIIIFSGEVLEVEKIPEHEQGEAKYCVTIQTLEMIVHVYLREDCENSIVTGGILSGTAWLYGDIVRAG